MNKPSPQPLGMGHVTPWEILENLELSQVHEMLLSLGIQEADLDEVNERIILPTVCHNEYNGSLKLYYYHNNKIFKCYTQCGDCFNLYEFLIRYHKTRGNKTYSFWQAQQWVKQMAKGIEEGASSYRPLYTQHLAVVKSIQLPELDKRIILPHQKELPQPWLEEGISEQAMRKFQIGYDKRLDAAIIPHLDYEGRLVGIRGRYFNRQACKYMPLEKVPATNPPSFYSHPLGQNLYGLYENQEEILKSGTVIILEGEKSILKHWDITNGKSNAVAICGCSLSASHVDILFKHFHIRHMVLALDRQYQTYPSAESRAWFQKLYKMAKKYSVYITSSLILDKEELLDYKDAPVDKGAEIFWKLYDNKTPIRA